VEGFKKCNVNLIGKGIDDGAFETYYKTVIALKYESLEIL
jgi:hypothetical protein